MVQGTAFEVSGIVIIMGVCFKGKPLEKKDFKRRVVVV